MRRAQFPPLTGVDWHRLAQFGTAWHRLAQIGTDSRRFARTSFDFRRRGRVSRVLASSRKKKLLKSQRESSCGSEIICANPGKILVSSSGYFAQRATAAPDWCRLAGQTKKGGAQDLGSPLLGWSPTQKGGAEELRPTQKGGAEDQAARARKLHRTQKGGPRLHRRPIRPRRRPVLYIKIAPYVKRCAGSERSLYT